MRTYGHADGMVNAQGVNAFVQNSQQSLKVPQRLKAGQLTWVLHPPQSGSPALPCHELWNIETAQPAHS